jgi:hypothetical protein
MAKDTVVQYVLKVDASGAQKALDTTSKEAEGASKSLNRIEQSSKGATQGINQTASAMKIGAKQARNFRRAGRDLDGALGDLAQGIGHLSPAMGSFLMEASDGVSIVEGLGRTLTLFTNPAVLAAGAVAVAAGAAFAIKGHEAEEARKKEEEMAKALEEATRQLEQQTKVINNAAKALAGYYMEVDQARTNLQVMTGELSQFEADQRAATAAAQDFGRNALEVQQQQEKALQASINSRTEEISQLRLKIGLMKEERAIQQSLAERIAGVPQQFGEQTFDEAEAQKRLNTLNKAQQADRERLKDVEGQRAAISGQQRSYEQILLQTAEINEQERRRSAAEKARQARLRKEAEEQRQREKEQQEILKAQEQIKKMLEQAEFKQLSTGLQILSTYEKQAEKLFDLLEISGDLESANAALAALTKLRDQQLASELEKNEQLRDQAEDRLRQERARAKQEQERAEKELLAQRKETISKFETIISLDPAGIVGLISPVAGAITGILQSLGERVLEKGPEQIRKEALAQAEAIKVGIAFLPELFLSIAPQLGVAIAEAFVDGVQLLFQNLIQSIVSAGEFFDSTTRGQRRERRRSFISDFFDPNVSASFMGGGRFVPSAQGGIRFTGQQDTLAQLHRGEFVVPQSGQRPQQVDRQLNNTTGGGMTININSAVVDRNAVDALVREIEIRFNNQFGTSSSSLFGGR